MSHKFAALVLVCRRKVSTLSGMDFHGTKLVLMIGPLLLTILRDDDPAISDPGLWDLPGGAREAGESAEACVLRETREEVGLRLPPEALIWRSVFADVDAPARNAVWFGARLPEAAAREIVLGDEGQCWRLVAPADWLENPRTIARFKPRVVRALEEMRDGR
jgi:8-oxo-dGTP diphosphatase